MQGSPLKELTPLGNQPAFEGGLQEVAERTYAWIQPNGELGESNAGLVIGESSSLLIDTLWDERLTRRMLDAMFPHVRGAPIATVLNTHGDGDHWYGNGVVLDAEVVATESAERQMRAEPPAMITRTGPLRTGASLLGRVPLLPFGDRIRGIAAFGAELGRYEIAGIKPRYPDRTFTGTATLDAGGRQVEAIEVGPAHTPGDAIAWVPDAGVVFAADIVFAGVTPIIWAGPVENWIRALNRIEALEPAVVVPGHGPACDVARVAELRDYWLWLEDAVRADGDSSAGAVTRRVLASSGWREAPWAGWRGPERTIVNTAMILRESKGKSGPVSQLERIGLLAEMGALRVELSG